MTISNDKGKKTPKGVKKLSVKKETVKDLDAGRGKAKELADDQLDAVNGGKMAIQGPGIEPQRVIQRSALVAAGCLRTRPSCEQTTPGGGC